MAMGALTYGVTVRDLTTAYATYTNHGVWRESRTYTVVYDSDGNVVLDNTQKTRQILSEKTVDYMNYMLWYAVNYGTASPGPAIQHVRGGKNRYHLRRQRPLVCWLHPLLHRRGLVRL